MSTRKTLVNRIIDRGIKTPGIVGHVRAELDLLCDKVRKLDGSIEKLCGNKHCADVKCSVACVKRKDVLALIRQQKR